MIDWDRTQQEYGITSPSGTRPTVVTICDTCGAVGHKRIYKKSALISNQLAWSCPKCVANRPDKKLKSSLGAKAAWNNQDYRNKIEKHLRDITSTDEYKQRMLLLYDSTEWKETIDRVNKTKQLSQKGRERIIESLKSHWDDPEYRTNITSKISKKLKELWKDDNFRAKTIAGQLSNWANQEYASKIRDIAKQQWTDPEYAVNVLSSLRSPETKSKISAAAKKNWSQNEYRDKIFDATKRVSKLQEVLYSILDDLNIEYYRERNDGQDDKECRIGPYSFDCVIPRQDKCTLLIECQGEYWHSSKDVVTRDKAKSSYIANNFGQQYEIKYIWEHEFYNLQKVVELIKYWVNGTTQTIDFSFNDVTIDKCPASDYKLLLSKYHYLANAGKGGIAYGAYLDDILIAVIIFSPLSRHNIKVDGYTASEIRELSRLCIHPAYQKKNFGSWFISKCIRKLPTQYRCIIAYSDTTFNHNGAVYKASNFAHDSDVPPDYWYVHDSGWVMHKQTLYCQAKRFGITEREYAEERGYRKVWGGNKLRFIYKR